MSDGETVISWPDEHTPERSVFHAVNELQLAAELQRALDDLVELQLAERVSA